MKILVLSDSHLTNLNKISFSEYDYVIHCGDYGRHIDILNTNNVLFVRGNCDDFGDKYLKKELFGRRILVTHGDLENVKYGYTRLIYRALEGKSNIVLFGHTHRPIYFYEENILFLNPGSYPDSYIEIINNDIFFITNNKRIKIEYKW